MSTSTTHLVYERLRAELLSGRHPPDARLKIGELGAAFAVSIGAVREALSRLTSEGLVVATPQRGFRVAPVSVEDLRDLTDIRTGIESQCLRRAVARGDAAWEQQVRSAHARLAAAPLRGRGGRFSRAWTAAHADFHRALASACGSPWLIKLREMLAVQNERYLELALVADRGLRDAAGEHRALMDAALARDADGLAALIAAHLDRTRASIEEAMARNAQG
jgi:DNA-binding GntR family transcriptional regulator